MSLHGCVKKKTCPDTSIGGGSADPAVNNALGSIRSVFRFYCALTLFLQANMLRAAKAAGVPKENIEKAIARVCNLSAKLPR